jgi:putative membrane protein
MSWTESIFAQLFNTVLMRPYFAVFFLTYLVGCSMHMGVKRATLFGIAGYLVAWLAELSSIHNGIPFGYYYYIETTKGKELWVMGVPFMDSMSFVFLAWASYSMALMAVSPVVRSGATLYLLETKKIRYSWEARLLGALFFVLLDIIIDPVALRGSRWFLGQIYGYPEPGLYFGVPVANFVGWFVVGCALIWALQIIDRFLEKAGASDWSGCRLTWRYVIGPSLYFGVLLFNLSVTFSIGEYVLAWVGVFIVLAEVSLLYLLLKGNLARGAAVCAVEAHLADFPGAVCPDAGHK